MRRAVWVMSAGDGSVKDTVNNVAENQDQIMLALIALVSMSIAALVYIIRNGKYAKDGAMQATAANNAVNNVGPNKSTIYEMVERIRDSVVGLKEDVTSLKHDQSRFDSHGWETLPDDLNSAVGITTTIRDLQNGHALVNEKLDTIISELRNHVGSHDHN